MSDLFQHAEDKKQPVKAPAKAAPARAPSTTKSAKKAAPAADSDYTAKDIEVLEGLEPVRRRPGMYIGGTDERAYHHLFAEVLDNAMQTFGAMGMTRELPLHQMASQIRLMRIYDGPSEVHRWVVARKLLGLKR